MRTRVNLIVLLCLAGAPAVAAEIPPNSDFQSIGADRAAIEALLATYTEAVSTKNEALFETLLLNRMIPFSYAGQAIAKASQEDGSRNYASFREGVFKGAPFTQTDRNVHIQQDGPLAEVSLVFVNHAPDGESWGFKTLQLLKTAGQWKIASEFYTDHAMKGPA